MATIQATEGALQEFQTALKGEWRRDVACQCQQAEPQCVCKRYFIDVAAMEKWMSLRSPDGIKNVDRLLTELQPRRSGFAEVFPIESRTILAPVERRCVRVFAILIEQGHGELITTFQNENFCDIHLHRPPTAYHTNNLKKRLKKHFSESQAEKIIDDFNDAKWAFCPPDLRLDMEENLEDGRFILPFCLRLPVNQKGGTASVYQVAVRKASIRDDKMVKALEKSAYVDPIFGECFQFAIKSFPEENEDIYISEREAFRGLKNSDTNPIVRFLGCYTHDAGDNRRTYNLLLEYGEMDLDEYWADELNRPPISTREIINYWRSLCPVAEALKNIHEFEFPLGYGSHMQVFCGWHADVKPANILRVNGEFKLADFGFAKFARRAEAEGTAPHQYIEGGTDSYGAPEVTCANSNSTPVRQEIDTWSFGCVLSVAATWVVLGFPGIRQFINLRITAAERHLQPSMEVIDRFHDGADVLPEIQEWHSYLREHVRKSDTATLKILDMVENSMLQREPGDRLTSSQLCTELERRLKQAELEAKTGSKIPKAVKEALLEDDMCAPDTGTPQPQLMLHQDPTQLQASQSYVATTNTSSIAKADMLLGLSKSRRLGKDRKLNSVPYAKTVHRREILEEELNLKRSIGFGTQKAAMSSPSVADRLSNGFKVNQHGLRLQQSNQVQPPHLSTTNLPYSHASKRPIKTSEPSSLPELTTSTHPVQGTQQFGLASTPYPSSTRKKKVSKLGGVKRLRTDDWEEYFFPPEPSLNPPTTSLRTTDNSTINHPTTTNGVIPPKIVIEEVTGKNSIITENQTPSHQSHSLDISPSTTVDPRRHETGDDPYQTQVSRGKDKSPRVEESDEYQTASPVNTFNTWAGTSFSDLQFDVCKTRVELDNKDAKRSPLFGIRREKDSYLRKFIQNRDMVLLIDNGTTMRKYWPIINFVAVTLAMKLAGLDKDGIDVRFTIDPENLNLSGLKGDKGIKRLKATLLKAYPEEPKNEYDQFNTDICEVLDSIFKEKKPGKAMTVITLTDGIWKGTVPCTKIHKKLIWFADTLAKRGSKERDFSIQFVRFGSEKKEDLQYLDNQLWSDSERASSDMVDEVPWTGRVTKMLVGSFRPDRDAESEDTDDEGEKQLEEVGLDLVARLIGDYDAKQYTPFASSSGPMSSPSRASLFPRTNTDTSTTTDALTTKSRASKFFRRFQ